MMWDVLGWVAAGISLGCAVGSLILVLSMGGDR